MASIFVQFWHFRNANHYLPTLSQLRFVAPLGEVTQDALAPLLQVIPVLLNWRPVVLVYYTLLSYCDPSPNSECSLVATVTLT